MITAVTGMCRATGSGDSLDHSGLVAGRKKWRAAARGCWWKTHVTMDEGGEKAVFDSRARWLKIQQQSL